MVVPDFNATIIQSHLHIKRMLMYISHDTYYIYISLYLHGNQFDYEAQIHYKIYMHLQQLVRNNMVKDT